MPLPLLTTIVGSYPQPDWLVDHERLLANTPPRVRLREVWRLDGDELEEAQNKATRLAVEEMEEAGLDIVSDGEIRRESYFNRFATALEGLDLDSPATTTSRSGKQVLVPRVVGPIARTRPVQVEDTKFLRSITSRPIKMTVPGPFTMSQLAHDEHYGNDEDLVMAYAAAVNDELKDLKAVGCDFVQIDEPYLQAHPERARELGVEAIDRALDGIEGTTVVHMCFGYAYAVKDKPAGYSFLPELDRCSATQISVEAAQPRLDPAILEQLPSKTIMLGVLDLGDSAVEGVDVIEERIRAGLKHLPPERLILAPDCGMKYLPRDIAFGKLKAMVQAARRVAETL